MKKNGLSDVVMSVLMILISIVLIGIVAGFVIPFVKNSLSDGSACLPYQGYFEFNDEWGYNCFSNGLHGLSIRAGADGEDIKGMKIVFVKAGESKVIGVDNEDEEVLDVGGMRMLNMTEKNIEIPFSGETRTYVYNAGAGEQFNSAEIYPVLKSGKVCDKSDDTNFVACGGISLKVR